MKKKKYFNKLQMQRGASLLEVILAIALSLMLLPFMYNQIADMNNAVKDIAIASRIVKSRDGIINYIRLNQALFNDDDGTEISEETLATLSPLAHSGWVFKTNIQGAEFTEIFLAFNIGSEYQTANIAKYIGDDAAIVSADNVAYSQNWAIGVVDEFNFAPGDLIFRIVHNFGGDDKTKFLHRGTLGNDGLNQMLRDLFLNNNNLINVRDLNTTGLVLANNVRTNFVDADKIVVRDNVSFNNGATVENPDSIQFKNLWVTKGIVGFTDVIAGVLSAPKKNVIAINKTTVTNDVRAKNIFFKNAAQKLWFTDQVIANNIYAGMIDGTILGSLGHINISTEARAGEISLASGKGYPSFKLCNGNSWTYPDENGKESIPKVNVIYIHGKDVKNDALNFSQERSRFNVLYK